MLVWDFDHSCDTSLLWLVHHAFTVRLPNQQCAGPADTVEVGSVKACLNIITHKQPVSPITPYESFVHAISASTFDCEVQGYQESFFATQIPTRKLQYESCPCPELTYARHSYFQHTSYLFHSRLEILMIQPRSCIGHPPPKDLML